MQYTGKIKLLGPIETITTNSGDRTKRTIVIEEVRETEYPGGIAIEQRQEKAELFSAYQVGDVVTVSLNSRAREYNGRRYNSISAWKVEGENAGQAAPAPAAATPAPSAASGDVKDDLPF